jgi:hypothetical protein
MRNCDDCKFGVRYVSGDNELLYIECRHSPPSVSVYPDQNKSFLLNIEISFPRMKEDDYCFQFKECK